MKRFAACVLAAVFVSSIALAQQPAKEGPAAMLSVVVTDARGNHVQSLTKDDFQLSLGGKPVPVNSASSHVPSARCCAPVASFAPGAT